MTTVAKFPAIYFAGAHVFGGISFLLDKHAERHRSKSEPERFHYPLVQLATMTLSLVMQILHGSREMVDGVLSLDCC